jgi:hypothetical protein
MSMSSGGFLLAIVALSLAACENHDWVSGQNMSQPQLHEDWKECSTFASEVRIDGTTQVRTGSPALIGAGIGGAIIGYGAASEIAHNQSFNQCMEARGWQAANSINLIGTMPPSFARAPIPRRQLLVQTDPVTLDVAHELHLNPPRGVLLTEVLSGGVASSAGLRSGDVIIGFNGANVTNPGDLEQLLTQVAPSSIVTAVVWRNNLEQPVQLHF